MIDLKRHPIEDGLCDVRDHCSDKDAAEGMEPLSENTRRLESEGDLATVDEGELVLLGNPMENVSAPVAPLEAVVPISI